MVDEVRVTIGVVGCTSDNVCCMYEKQCMCVNHMYMRVSAHMCIVCFRLCVYVYPSTQIEMYPATVRVPAHTCVNGLRLLFMFRRKTPVCALYTSNCRNLSAVRSCLLMPFVLVTMGCEVTPRA